MRKSKAQRIHALYRIEERIGSEVSSKQLVKHIQDGEAEFLYKPSKRLSVFRFTNERVDIVVVYDKNRKQVVTVYPYSGSNEERKRHEQETSQKSQEGYLQEIHL